MEDDMPCGMCDVGTYDHTASTCPAAIAIRDGGPLPRCKSYNRTCIGALDLKACFTDNEVPIQQDDST